MTNINYEKNKENGQFKKINEFSEIKNNDYVIKWLENVESKDQRISLMSNLCNFLEKTPTDLAKEHQDDLKKDVLERSNIAKLQLNNFFGYLTNTKDSKWENTLNNKKIDKAINWNSARQYVFSKLLSYYKWLGIPVVYGRNEKPHKEDKNVNEKVWRKDGFDDNNKPTKKVVLNEKTILKQIRDSFNSLRDKAIFLGKISSSLDDVDIFNLKIKDYIEGHIPDYNICYLQGNRQKDKVLYQSFFGTEACNMIELYLTERKDKNGKEELSKNEYLFTTTNGKQMKQRYFTEKMKEVVDMLNLYNITPKSLRRFFKTTLEANSINTGFIRRLMGHIGTMGDNYNMKFEQAKEGVREALALDFYENVDSLISLGNGNKKLSNMEKEFDELKIRNKGLETTLDEFKSDNKEMKRALLSLFVKAYEIDDLNDLEELSINREYDVDKTDNELKEYNKRENELIQYALKIKNELE